jgi:hypothetical protein
MSVATPPLPEYAFMAWCLVKAQGQLYLYLYGSYGNRAEKCELDSSGSGYGPVVDSCKHGNEPSGSSRGKMGCDAV